MSRKNEIDNFLKQVYKYFDKNNYQFDEGLIYQFLGNYDLEEKDLNLDTSVNFNYWIQNFNNRNDLKVYKSDLQPHFLQFRSDYNNEAKHIKLYLNLEPNALYEGVNIIFDYITKNNIKTVSKVADRIRSDEIVLRVSYEDGIKLIDFINSNSFLNDNSRRTNPFLNREGIVGISYDDLLSYNSCVSYFVKEYFKTTNKPNYKDFLKFLEVKYKNLFQNQIELEDFINSSTFKNNLTRVSEQFGTINNPKLYLINNYRIVLETMLNNISLESYKNISEFMNDSKEIFNMMTRVSPKVLVNEYIRYAYSKYNNVDTVISALNSFKNGTVESITRDNNFRDNFIYNINPSDIDKLCDYDIQNYVINTINYSDTDTINIDEDDFNIFIDALKTTYNNHGDYQIEASISELLNGNFNVISNGSFGYRNYFKNKYSVEELKKIASDYIERIISGRTIRLDNNIGATVLNVLKSEYGFENDYKKYF